MQNLIYRRVDLVEGWRVGIPHNTSRTNVPRRILSDTRPGQQMIQIFSIAALRSFAFALGSKSVSASSVNMSFLCDNRVLREQKNLSTKCINARTFSSLTLGWDCIHLLTEGYSAQETESRGRTSSLAFSRMRVRKSWLQNWPFTSWALGSLTSLANARHGASGGLTILVSPGGKFSPRLRLFMHVEHKYSSLFRFFFRKPTQPIWNHFISLVHISPEPHSIMVSLLSSLS